MSRNPTGSNKIMEIKNGIVTFIVKYKEKEFLAYINEKDMGLLEYTWCCHYREKRKKVANVFANKNNKIILLHRTILNVTKTKILVDHIDGNPLNNCRNNLRICNNGQNLCNRDTPSNNTSGYKGVSYNKKMKKYEAYIKYNEKKMNLGYFTCPKVAAKAYNEAAIKFYGEFSKLNKI